MLWIKIPQDEIKCTTVKALPIKTATFKTLGCRLNQAEMDVLARRLQDQGVRILPFGEAADLTVINTCAVTRDADRDSRYAIRQAIRKSPKGRTVVTGCYTQMSAEAVRAIDGVDLMLANDEKMKLLDYLQLPESKDESPKPKEEIVSKARANLKVQDGCDYHCSFCIIPFARGRARSLPFGAVVREAEDLVSRGFLEIVLTGVNIGTYCSDDDGCPRRFVDLADRLQEIPSLVRLRISSIEPNTVTDGLLRLMSRSRVICPHLHIPIQSASDATLAAMRRKYRRFRLERLIDKIRSSLPEAGLGTDVIAGFPGETEHAFEESLRFLDSAGFTYVHAFPFSGRPGTPAARMAGQIPAGTIRRRLAILRETDAALRERFARRFLGRTVDALFENPDGNGSQEGTTANYLRVTSGEGHFGAGRIAAVKVASWEGGRAVVVRDF